MSNDMDNTTQPIGAVMQSMATLRQDAPTETLRLSASLPNQRHAPTASMRQPALSPRRMQRAATVRERYGTAVQFGLTFTPANQVRFCRDVRRCHLGTAPTLDELADAYGADFADTWLATQLQDLNEYSGARDKMTPAQRQDAAAAMRLARGGGMKVTEWMLFFRQLKGGQYGRFYGAADAMMVGEALGKFLTERAARLARYEAEERAARLAMQRKEWAATAITREEFERRGRGLPVPMRSWGIIPATDGMGGRK